VVTARARDTGRRKRNFMMLRSSTFLRDRRGDFRQKSARLRQMVV